jgi:tRNA(Ile)-lysidine synthase
MPAPLPEQLSLALADVPGRLVLGYSGGLDSTVLLHALVRAGLSSRLVAVHVHHGLQSRADQWQAHCQQQAAALGVAFIAHPVTVAAGGNLEARARRARREGLIRHVGPDDVLLLAHHRQDQAETLLLRLLRGAGARGLASMAPRSRWHGADIRRPLLAWPHSALVRLAQQWQLSWIDDPSNDQIHFDRNFLRHRILPVLQARWPEAEQRIALSAGVLAEQSALLDELARDDMIVCEGDGRSLSLAHWAALSPARRRNLLYGWLRQRGMRPPSADKLVRVETELLPAGPDRQPRIVWPDGILTRYRERLWLLSPRAVTPLEACVAWDPQQQPCLSLGDVTVRCAAAAPLSLRAPSRPLVVRAAGGGERLLLGGMHRQLSELWRAAGIPPWQRRRLPLFFVGEELVAAAAAGVADNWSPDPTQAAFHLLIEDSAL